MATFILVAIIVEIVMTTSKEVVLKMFEPIRKGTKYVLEAIPMDKLDHSVEPDSATIGELAFHISTMPLGSALFAQGKFDKFPETDVLLKEFSKYLGDSLEEKNYPDIWEKSCEVFLDYFGNKTADQWNNETYEHFLTRGPRNYLEGFLAMQNHMIQHRGSLVSTLRSAGVPVGLKQYWGMKKLDN